MSNSRETIADIAAEKRRIAKEIRDHASNGDYWDKKRANETAEDLEEEADRLEAAHKRECGDCAKLREAVELILKERGILDFCHNNIGSKTWKDWDVVYMTLRKWVDKAMTALAAPARNCDVGTAKEQSARFEGFCNTHFSHEKGCDGCPLLDNSPSCVLVWAQMPYEEGGIQ